MLWHYMYRSQHDNYERLCLGNHVMHSVNSQSHVQVEISRSVYSKQLLRAFSRMEQKSGPLQARSRMLRTAVNVSWKDKMTN